MKVLNLYAGIGGNRKLWDEVTDVDVTAIEINEEIAQIYQDHFPNDEVIVTDAHEYLKNNYEEYDFIWGSPPCPTHSRMVIPQVKSDDEKRGNHKYEFEYPDMKLYQEVILLDKIFEGDWCVENVISYYEPLIEPQVLQRHYFWSNIDINRIDLDSDDINHGGISFWEERFGYDLSGYNLDVRKDKILRSCVHPKLGKHILECALSSSRQETL